ncbi:MAG: hypothetical protein ACRC2J_02615 [Microcoleaceae cyanobacterium]
MTIIEVLELTPQAFITALATVEKELPTEMITAIQKIGQAYQAGDIQSLAQLEKIATLDADFYQVYENAYEELLAIDEAKEKNKHISNLPIDRESDDADNFLAPILNNINPTQKAQETVANSLKQGIISTVQWVSQNIRLS